MSKTSKLYSAVIGSGLVDGLLAGIQSKTGQDVSSTGVMYTVLNAFCKTLSTTPNSSIATTNCYSNLFWYGVLIFVAGIAITIGVITSIKDWKVGAALYGLGFVIGFALVYS